MSLHGKIMQLYPALTVDDFGIMGTIRLQNDSDGRGDYIAKWEHPDYPQPTDEQLAGINQMPLYLNGTEGVYGVNGTNTTPANRGSDTNTGIVYGTDTVQIATGGTTAVTVDSSQRLAVGGASVAGRVQSVADGYAAFVAQASTSGAGKTVQVMNAVDLGVGNWANAVYGATSHQWTVTGSEAARIDSSGNLSVGTTAGGGRVDARSSASGTPIFRCYNMSTAFEDNIIIMGADRNTTNNSFYAFSYYNYGAAAYKMRVADSGNITNTNNSYTGISDIKLKQDITDASSQWDDIKALRIRKYHFKDDATGPLQIGVIAQEIEQISPGLVEEHFDRDADGNDLGTITKAVKYSVLYMKAVKALQEAMEKIETLDAKLDAAEARIAALEAK